MSRAESTERPPVIDRLLGYLSPSWAAHRSEARAKSAYFDGARRVVERHGLGRQDIGASYPGGVSTRASDPYSLDSYGQTGVRAIGGANFASMRDRARALVKRNVLASAIIQASANFVIGSGTRIEPTTNDKTFNSAVSGLWDAWWNGRDGGSPDVRGLCHGPELERMLWMARLRDGDAGLVLLSDGRLQAIEGDIISTPDKFLGQFKIADGVELDERGRPLAYHLRTFAENAPLGARVWARVPAEDFVYLPRLKRVNQIRGETAFAQSFGLFEQVDGYIEAVVMAARMAAMFGLLIKEGARGYASLPQLEDSRGVSRPALDMEPGMVKYLGPNDEVVQINPQQPTTQFEQFMVSLVRLTGLELGLPLEVSMLDFSRTTYSSARAAFIVAQRGACAEHGAWASRFISRVYRWRVSKWIKDNELPTPSDAQPWKHRAIQEPYAYLDPVKDVQGDMMAVDAGFATLGEMLHARGTTLEEFIAKRRQEIDALDAAGIKLSKSNSTRDEGMTNQGNVNGESPAQNYGN